MLSITEKAKEHNLLIHTRAQARLQEEQREIDSKKTQIEEKLTRAANLRSDPAEKAKVHNQKVQEKVTNAVTCQMEAADSRKQRIDAKLEEAASRRGEVIEQVQQKAAQSAVPRGSSISAIGAAAASEQEQSKPAQQWDSRKSHSYSWQRRKKLHAISSKFNTNALFDDLVKICYPKQNFNLDQKF